VTSAGAAILWLIPAATPRGRLSARQPVVPALVSGLVVKWEDARWRQEEPRESRETPDQAERVGQPADRAASHAPRLNMSAPGPALITTPPPTVGRSVNPASLPLAARQPATEPDAIFPAARCGSVRRNARPGAASMRTARHCQGWRANVTPPPMHAPTRAWPGSSHAGPGPVFQRAAAARRAIVRESARPVRLGPAWPSPVPTIWTVVRGLVMRQGLARASVVKPATPGRVVSPEPPARPMGTAATRPARAPVRHVTWLARSAPAVWSRGQLTPGIRVAGLRATAPGRAAEPLRRARFPARRLRAALGPAPAGSPRSPPSAMGLEHVSLPCPPPALRSPAGPSSVSPRAPRMRIAHLELPA